MMNYSQLNYGKLELDFEAVATETISLKSEEINRSAQFATEVENETQQWQIYLSGLGLFAFEKWLKERDREIAIDRRECSILHPNILNSLATVCNLKVGDFKVCLIAVGMSIESEIICARAAIELPEFIPHFYVWLEIQEEYEQAIIRGFLRYDRLQQLAAKMRIELDTEWNYKLPVNWFDRDSDRLLLYLRCLDPAAIPLPEIPQHSLANLAKMQAEIMAILTNLQTADRTWWEMLNWQQAVTLLSAQNHLKLAEEGERSAEIFQIENLLQIVTRSALNVSLWLEDKIDELAEGLSWVLMPVFAPAGAGLRCGTEELENIITELGSAGIEIPFPARGAYREIKLGEYNLRLYAVTWSFLSEENVPEWTLMLILGTKSSPILPVGVKLRVSDSTGILVQRMTGQNNRDGYLYAQIAGNWDEKFLVSVSLKDKDKNSPISVTLPPFTFRG